MSISISELRNGGEAEWNTYLVSAEDAHFHHSAGWKGVTDKTYGHETRYLIAREDGQIRGVLPLFVVRSRLFGNFVASNPGGICASSPGLGQDLLDRAMGIADENDADNLLIAASRKTWDGDLVTIQRHCTQIVSLPSDPDVLWRQISRHKRKNINTALRNDLSVDVGDREHLDFFYEAFVQKLRVLGTPVFGKALLFNILEAFPSQTQILLASRASEPIGALLMFANNGTIYAQWMASLDKYRQYRPNDLLYWELLRWGCVNGFRMCDLGRSQWGSGNYRFKDQFGAETVPLYYQYYIRRGIEIPDFEFKVERSVKYQLAVRGWQRMPLGLTQRLGPTLRKYLYPF